MLLVKKKFKFSIAQKKKPYLSCLIFYVLLNISRRKIVFNMYVFFLFLKKKIKKKKKMIDENYKTIFQM
jgi:hypothetical protein